MDVDGPLAGSTPPSMEARYSHASSVTPNGKDRRDCVVTKTPLSVMSSSLKERLKKCGRYHPATPPSVHQNSPLSSQKSISSSQLQTTPLSRRRITPVTDKQSPAATNSTQRKLPQPRNILKERSNFGSACEPKMSVEDRFKDSVCTVENRHSRREDDQSNIAAGIGREGYVPGKETVSHASSPLSRTGTQGQTTGPAHHQDAAIRDSKEKNLSVSKTLFGTTSGRSDSELVDHTSLMVTKRQKNTELTGRKEVLRKLTMVKTYRSKNDLDHLQGLIDKWRSVCQQAVHDLHQLTPEPRPSLTQLVQQLGVDQELMCYNDEEECFETL